MKTYIHFRPIPTTLEELKSAYKRLAIANHPDHGGSTETMQQINAEYTDLFEQLKNTHRNAAGEQYTSRDTTDEAPAEFIELIEKLIRLPGIIIELCGSWLWITGDTKPVKDELKSIGFRWSSSKNRMVLPPRRIPQKIWQRMHHGRNPQYVRIPAVHRQPAEPAAGSRRLTQYRFCRA